MTDAARLAHEAMAELLEAIPIDPGGGCSVFRASLMGSLIIDRRLRRIVEIGGSSGALTDPVGGCGAEVEGSRVWGSRLLSLRHLLPRDSSRLGTRDRRVEAAARLGGNYATALEHLAERGLAGHTELLRMASREAVDRST
jgi:hypothetical protein